MSIKKDLVNGVFFTAVAKYSGLVVSLVISAVLARLITPEDFGVVGIATVIIAFFNILGDIGIGPAIIQRKNLTKEDLNQIYSLTVYIGIGLCLLFILLAYPISKIYSDSTLVGVCQWLSLTILFTCINIVPINLRYKNKDFKKIAYVTLIVQVVAGAVSIFYAYCGGGVYALVLSSVVSSGLLAIIYNCIAKMHFSFKIRIDSLRKIMSFSVYQFFFNIIVYLSRNLDKLLIGKYISLTQLGYYEKSYRLMMLPLQNITFVINPVLLPIFSEYQTDKQFVGQKYLTLLKLLAYLSFPLSVILFACAPEIVLFVFGSQWGPSILPFKILSFTVALQILTSTTGSIYQAIDATKQLFISGCWGAFFMVVSFFVSIFCWHTLEAVCYGYLCAQLANTIQCFWIIFNLLRISKWTAVRMLIRPLIISIILFACYYAFSLFRISYPLFIQLVIKSLFGVIISVILIQFISPYDVIKLIKNKLFHNENSNFPI